ncbi:serine/threonine-protein kinase GA29083 isoform X2 [Belonocnema kinseyi]|uniref:serine/threonine-protein kinase GA29083 isoform X2 n=1 Tax=Belonocnema kinseyi TaxID=2817044 RepID=UPI00143CCAC4|nr:serine/threonine-protein kinase GA29083 isoform X2 [Belonocnema kinseyi]
MTEEPIGRCPSPSGDSNLSGGGEIHTSAIVASLEERLMDITARHSLNALRTPPTKKAKRVRFFRNGDKFYTGVVMAVTPERYRSFDSLASDLTRALVSSVTLPSGVRAIYTMDGRKVQTVGDLEDGKCYVVSGQGEMFKKVEYSSSKVRRGSSLSGLPQSPAGTGRQISAIPGCVKAKIITLIRNGTKPRRVVRLLLNKRNAPSLEHVLEAITEAVKLDSGAVRKVYSLSGQQINSLDQFFENEEIFVACGTEKPTQEDFELVFEESKCVQSFRRGVCPVKRQGGPMPKMPRKSGKKSLTAPQVRTPSPASLILPQPLRLHYTVGHVIGDGNFAVVRHCVHKSTGAEYAIKIVDKYKCQGKETMLASEVAILRQVCHPNIISLISEQETTDQLFLVMELVKGGDLFDAIAAATKFSESEASVMIGHLTSALAYLHSHHIVHRDVKPENLLVEMEGSQVRCLKLADFGLAQVVVEPLFTVCGTPTYVAPEILAEMGYGLKIDVWAAGVILYILLCGFPPFVSPDNEQEELFERILSGQYEFTSPYWDNISDSAKMLISNMLQAQPELRFSAEDVLDHPWLTSFLGGEQTSAADLESPEQHGYQQRQPIRVATFEFDYKKQRRNEIQRQAKDESDNVKRGRWTKVEPISHTRSEIGLEIEQDNIARGRDEVDFINANYNERESFSLSNDCLKDLDTATRSLNDLTLDLEKTITEEKEDISYRKGHAKPSHSVASSLNSIPENLNSPEEAPFAKTITPEKNSPSSKRNGIVSSNLDSNFTSPKTPLFDAIYNYETPKSLKSTTNRARLARKNLYKLSKANGDVKSDGDIGKISRDACFSSMDYLSGTSDNEIETSDSFVNVQLATIKKGRKSVSSQSLESSESFENVKFSKVKDVIVVPTKAANHRSESQDNKNPIPSFRQTRSKVAGTSKSCKPSQIPVQRDDKVSSARNKTQENSKNAQNEAVKRRTKANNQSETKTDAWSKRHSYVPQCSTKKTSDSNELSRPKSTTVNNTRKFSSSDELREEKRTINAKTKRFSLYYTPQPSRKAYEDPKVEKSKNAETSNNKSAVTKCLVSGKKKEETSTTACERKDSLRSRKSAADSSTVASRSKTNRQSVYNRSNAITNSARTK